MGLRHKLLLVQVDDQHLLLSVNNTDIQTLHAWRAATPSSAETGVNHAN
jgi:flagellar biogenesis protein FliO